MRFKEEKRKKQTLKVYRAFLVLNHTTMIEFFHNVQAKSNEEAAEKVKKNLGMMNLEIECLEGDQPDHWH